MNVVLLATGRLPRSYFTNVRADLGDEPSLELDVIAWSPPREPLGDTVGRYVLIGPGRMPVAPATGTGTAPSGSAAGPVAGPVAPGALSAAAVPTPASPAAALLTRPAWSPRRLAGGLRRRARRARQRLGRSGPWAKLRGLRTDQISREYWTRLRSRHDALDVIGAADIVIALDSRSVRAGWHLARRPGAPTVVLGVQAAVRDRAARAAGG